MTGQRRDPRRAAFTIELARPVACLNMRPKSRTVCTQFDRLTPSRSKMGAKSSGIAPHLSRPPGPSDRIVRVRKELAPARCDLGVGPVLDAVGSIGKHEMQMIAHNGVTTHINSEESGEVAEPIDNPRLTVRVITTGVAVGAEKEGSADAPSNAVIHTHERLLDDVAAAQRQARKPPSPCGCSTSAIVFTGSVMDKNSNSGAAPRVLRKNSTTAKRLRPERPGFATAAATAAQDDSASRTDGPMIGAAATAARDDPGADSWI